MKSQQQEILAKYNYDKDKPLYSASNYTVYSGTIKENNSPVTIKTLKYPHVELGTYLKKVKQCKSQNVIKIYELLVQQQVLIVVTEQIIYSNLKSALKNCNYLDEPDAIFVTKQILSGYVDLLRADTNWFGTEEDIEFGSDGLIRLSWNNGIGFNLVNPIPAIIAKFSVRSTKDGPNSILPFPISKSLEELMRISKENASEISMNPQMKKKQRPPKRKGKDWIALKQYKNKNEYFDELSYFAVHSELGFIRVKVFDQGKISPNLLQLNKTKSSFTKVHDLFDEGNKTLIISEYSNDGNLQSYVTRLKTAGVKLKEDQIEFFVYSLLEPIKMVQESTLKAICMLHIKNIFIENGIPKIGEPIPINEKITEVLIDRKEVPDFYHPEFKGDPTQRQQKFDTYSLGVLLYKLMYTQMPIFPEPGKVHTPSSPAYKKNLKDSVLLFLTQSAPIRQIQQQISMSDQVKKQIQQNKQLLKKSKQGQPQLKVEIKDPNAHQSDDDHEHEEPPESSSDDQNGNPKHEEEDDEEEAPGCCDHFMKKLHFKDPKKISSEKRYAFVDQLQLSSFKNFRLWSKSVIILVLYVFLFYYIYIQNSVLLLASQGLLSKVDLTIGSKNVSIISTDRYEFEKVFNKTGRSMSQLQNMNCLIQDQMSAQKYSGFLKEDSEAWYGYLFGGLGAMILILIFKLAQIHYFDDIHAWFRKQQGQGYFNLWNWILMNLHWVSLITGHFFLFHFIYEPQIEPCVGHKKGQQWGSTQAFFNDRDGFVAPFSVVFGLQVLVYLCYFIVILNNEDLTKRWNKVFNTLTLFGVSLFVFFLIVRIGAIMRSSYYPAAATDHSHIIINQIKNGNYVLLFGIVPQLLFIMQFICLVLINWVYYTFVDKNQRLLNNDATLDASLKDIV